MQNILTKIPPQFWLCLGLALLPIGFGIGTVLVKSSEVSLTNSNGETSITIDTAQKIKKASNNTEYANDKLATEIAQIKETLEFFINNDTTPDPVLQTVKKDLEELEPTVKEIERNNEELKEIVESVSDRANDEV